MKMFAKSLLAGALAMCLSVLPVSAATLVSYVSTDGASLPASFVAAGISASDVTRGPGLGTGAGGTFNSNNWTVGGTKTDAINAGDFLLWSFTAVHPVSLTELLLGYRRSAQGPQSIALDIAVNGGGFSQIWETGIPNDLNQSATIALGSFTSVTEAQFRLVGWNAGQSVGTLRLANTIDGQRAIALGGTPVTAIPLPPALPLLGAGLLLFAALRRRAA